MNKPEGIAGFLRCSSFLEENTSLLYQSLANQVDLPLIKSILLHIVYDSQKHSVLLNGVYESIGRSKTTLKDCQKKMGPAWRTIEDLKREISFAKKITRETASSLVKKLAMLESNLGEEYSVLVQMKTLEYMAREIHELYNVELQDMKDILEVIIKDEETHKELLSKMERFLARDKRKTEETDSVFKYPNRDSWSRQMPDSVHGGAV